MADHETLEARLARLEAQIRTRDEFLSLASHELRTPLTPLRLALDSLLRRLSRPALDTARATREVEQSLQQVQRLTGLVDRMMDVTRITAGKLTLDRARCALMPVVRRAVDGFHAQAKAAGCVIELVAPPETEVIAGSWDGFRLEQVLVNVLSNAIKYAPGGPIKVEVGADGAHARVTVTDSGKGVPAEQSEQIFELFQRGDGEKKKKEGLGLGLFLARNIVAAHGGTLHVESARGTGASFVVTLPLE